MSYNSYSNNSDPYRQDSGYGGYGGYGQSQQEAAPEYGNPYVHSQHDNDNYELQPVGNGGAPGAGGHGTTGTAAMSQSEFLNATRALQAEIQELQSEIDQIEFLHSRALSGDAAAQADVDRRTTGTQAARQRIQARLRELQADAEHTPGPSFDTKKKHFDLTSNAFKQTLHAYLAKEQDYQNAYRDQIARQYRIANPAASDGEVRQALEQDWSNEGVFQSALRNNRQAQASTVLGNVRARHNELQKIQQSIAELAQMFDYVNTLVVQQEAVVQRAEEQTHDVVDNIEQGNVHVEKGVEHARRRRRNKWWCALVVLLIIIAIALGVGLGVYFTNQGKKTADNATGGGN